MGKQMRIIRIVTCGIAIILLLVGCATTSLTQISAFGTSASSIADNSKKAFELIDASTIDRKMYDVASDPSLNPKDDTFEGLFKGPAFQDLQVRIDMLEKLGSYAKALEELATADFRKDVDAASTDLYGALSGLSTTYKKATSKELPLNDNQLKLVATAVDAIGTAVVESKRRDAIKTVIIQADDAVQIVAKLLETDFGKSSALAAFVKQNLTNADGSLRTAYNTQRQAAGSTFNLRYEMLLQIRQMHDAAETSSTFFYNISSAAKKMSETHASLKAAVTKDEFSSAELAKQIGELVTYAKSINSFYEKLGTKK